MPTRRPLVLALATLSLASGGNAVAGDPGWIDVISYSWGSSQSAAGPVDGNRSITIDGHRTESVGATPADRDVQLKGQKILQNAPGGAAAARGPAARMTAAPGVQEAYLQYELKPAMITSYSMSADGSMQPEGGKALQNAADAPESYTKHRFHDLLISPYMSSGNAASAPAPQRYERVPPTSPASAGVLKVDGIDPKAAIAINTPLRTLPSRSAADGSGSPLMKLETLPRQAPGFGAPVGRR